MIALVDADSAAYQAAWKQTDMDEAVKKFNHLINADWITPVWADKWEVYIGGDNNFRYELCPAYKANRKEIPKDAKLFRPLLKRLADDGIAIPSHGMEADDMVRIRSHECMSDDIAFTVVHIDKDLDCIPGAHYNPRKEEHYEVSEDAADLHYWTQMLKGDMTDNLPGLPKVGPVKALKMLDGIPMGRRKARVLAAYRGHYGRDKWKEKLLETANGIHILRNKDDYFEL